VNHRLGEAEREFRPAEFATVIFIGFGLSIVTSLVAIYNYDVHRQIVAFNDMHLWSVVAYEVIFGGIIFLILRHSGWRWRDFHVHYSNWGTLFGFGLAAIAIASLFPVRWIFGSADVTKPAASMLAVVAASLINPWYEELLVCAYVIEALRKRFGLAVAVNASIALRLSYHLYQGPQAWIAFTLFGLIMSFAYVKTGRLWPVIVAHATEDFLGLAGF
jgi:membrane protease YdiL (CAAX protease family)